MKQRIKELSRGRHLEEHLPVYGNYLGELYFRSAVTELAMDYYTYYEMMEDRRVQDQELDTGITAINEILHQVLIPGAVDEQREAALDRIHALRNHVYHVVEVLSAYADIFSRYEYVFNRCEYLFKEPPLTQKSDERFTKQLVEFIFSEADNAVINRRISDVVGELPLRMTKGKFFQYLTEGLTVYKQTDHRTLDDFIYMIRTSAMLQLPEGLEEFKDLYEIYTFAKNLDYEHLTEEQLTSLEQKLTYSSDFIIQYTDFYEMLQRIINKTYASLLCLPYSDVQRPEVRAALDIIQSVVQEFGNTGYHSLSDEITEGFGVLEGVPERLHGELSSVEFVLDNIFNQHLPLVQSLMCGPLYQGLFMSQRLLSDSLFIDLSQVDVQMEQSGHTEEHQEQISVADYVDIETKALIEDLTAFFKANQKAVNRSVMAIVLAKLPVFFNNVAEVQDYIYYAFSGCTKKAEKIASMEILQHIMTEE